MSYSDDLRDPRWQRKRLEVMQREDFRCQDCKDATTTLNVHHTYYKRGHKPWEYPSASLRCLCERCHAGVTSTVAEMQQIIGDLPLSYQRTVLGFARVWRALANNTSVIPVEDTCVADGIAFTIACKFSIVWNARDSNGCVDFDALARNHNNWDTTMYRPEDTA